MARRPPLPPLRAVVVFDGAESPEDERRRLRAAGRAIVGILLDAEEKREREERGAEPQAA